MDIIGNGMFSDFYPFKWYNLKKWFHRLFISKIVVIAFVISKSDNMFAHYGKTIFMYFFLEIHLSQKRIAGCDIAIRMNIFKIAFSIISWVNKVARGIPLNIFMKNVQITMYFWLEKQILY